MGYSVEQYEHEKILGLRRSNGAKRLKRLSTLHRKVIALHIRGESGSDISSMVDKSEAWVSTILNDPLAQAIIQQFHIQANHELDALQLEAVDVVRRGLRADDFKTNFAAIDRMNDMRKLNDKGKDALAEGSKASAEEVAQRLINLAQDSVTLGIEAVRQGKSPLPQIEETPYEEISDAAD